MSECCRKCWDDNLGCVTCAKAPLAAAARALVDALEKCGRERCERLATHLPRDAGTDWFAAEERATR